VVDCWVHTCPVEEDELSEGWKWALGLGPPPKGREWCGYSGRSVLLAWVILGLFAAAALYFGLDGSWLVGWPR